MNLHCMMFRQKLLFVRQFLWLEKQAKHTPVLLSLLLYVVPNIMSKCWLYLFFQNLKLNFPSPPVVSVDE